MMKAGYVAVPATAKQPPNEYGKNKKNEICNFFCRCAGWQQVQFYWTLGDGMKAVCVLGLYVVVEVKVIELYSLSGYRTLG